jgi:hypothetical protein
LPVSLPYSRQPTICLSDCLKADSLPFACQTALQPTASHLPLSLPYSRQPRICLSASLQLTAYHLSVSLPYSRQPTICLSAQPTACIKDSQQACPSTYTVNILAFPVNMPYS